MINILRKEENIMIRSTDVKKYIGGEIYYWENPLEKDNVTCSKIAGCRPVIVVKSSFRNRLVTIIPCTSRDRGSIDYEQIKLQYKNDGSFGFPLVNQITTVDSRELGRYLGKLKSEKFELLKKVMIDYLNESDECDEVEWKWEMQWI